MHTSSQLQKRLSELVGNIAIPCTVAFIWGIVLKRHGLSNWQGLTIIIGAVLSIVCSLLYSISILVYGKEKSWRNAIFTFSGAIPFLFGCFLVFYKGFWSFKYLFASFSFGGLIAPIIWILLGYRIVSQLHIMTELDNLTN